MMQLVCYLFVGLGVFVADQITKFCALVWCQECVTIFPGFSCEVMFNRGISWGMLHSASSLLFAMVNVLIVGIFCAVLWSAYRSYKSNEPLYGYVLVLSGALSNLLDRIMYHGVVDFIVVYYGNWFWPSFNLADAAIVIGTVILIIRGLRS